MANAARCRAFAGGIAFFLAAAFPGAAAAALTSPTYRILISDQPSVGNSGIKSGGPFSLYGNTTFLGNAVAGAGRYSISWGILNVVRPAQLDLTNAHVYPNPCNAAKGCNGVTFTRLTMDADIYVYTISGELVRRMEKTGNIDSIGWDLRNGVGAKVASGVYLYFIKAEGISKKGKMIVIR